jgi:NAD+ kinase
VSIKTVRTSYNHKNADGSNRAYTPAHTLSNRPIVLSSESLIEVTLVQVNDAQISFDGQFQLDLEFGDRVIIKRADRDITLLHPSDYCYFEMLRNKLNWG